MKEKLLNGLNNFLVFDTFVVVLSALWLLVGLMGRMLGIPLGLDLWYTLWQPVFTPAIGILIIGGVFNGIMGQVRKRLPSSQ